MIELLNVDCLEYMATLPDNAFDIAIVDPEYGIGASEMTMGSGKNKQFVKGKKWDIKPPNESYFKELFRVSKNQIIWGGNYFTLPISRGWIFWDKGINGDCSFADGELAWTSFDTVLRRAAIRYKGFLGMDKNRIHITQKPKALYQWLFKNYVQPGWKILDTHLGSGSSAIAAYHMGFDFVGCEIDKDYFDQMQARYNRETDEGMFAGFINNSAQYKPQTA